MKKMIPVYLLLAMLIASVWIVTKRLTQHLALIEQQLAGSREDNMILNGDALRVYVVNEPDVRVRGSVDVRVENYSLNVDVQNTPDVRLAYQPIEVEIVR